MAAGATTTITGSFSTSPGALLALITNVLNACSTTWGTYAAFTFGSGSSLNFHLTGRDDRRSIRTAFGTPPENRPRAHG